MSNEVRRLTKRQRAFVDEYLVDENGTQAAIRAGYSANAARGSAARLLAQENVSSALAEKREALARREAKKGDIGPDKVLRELGRIALLDIRKVLHDDGSMVPVSELDDDTAAAVSALQVQEMLNSEGKVTARQHRYALESKTKALQTLARIYGLEQQSENLHIQGSIVQVNITPPDPARLSKEE